MKTLEEISQIELDEKWEEAVDSLEKRLEQNPLEKETILRLMFLYWYLIVENGPIKHNFNINKLENKMKELFERSNTHFAIDAEYQWIIGYIIRFYEIAPGWDISLPFSLGEKMMRKAQELSHENPVKSFEGRGQLGDYFSSVIYQI